MNPSMTRIESAAATIRERLGLAELAVILGSGLGDQVKALEEGRSLSYAEIPGMPASVISATFFPERRTSINSCAFSTLLNS